MARALQEVVATSERGVEAKRKRKRDQALAPFVLGLVMTRWPEGAGRSRKGEPKRVASAATAGKLDYIFLRARQLFRHQQRQYFHSFYIVYIVLFVGLSLCVCVDCE